MGGAASAALVGLGALVAAAVLADALGVRPLHSRGGSAVLLAGAVAVAVAVGRWGHASRAAGNRRRPLAALVAAAPALVVLLDAALARALPLGQRVEWYLGGDHVRHLVMTAQEQAEGTLSYDLATYPRGWHTLNAAVWGTLGIDPASSIAQAVDVSALLTWSLSAALALATAALATSLGSRAGLSGRAAAGAGFLAGCATLWPVFQANYQALGLEASLLAACVLAVVLRGVLDDATGVRGLLGAAAGVVVVAHTWQLLLPVVGLALLWSGWSVARRGGRPAVGTAVVLLATALASAPALAAVVSRVGVGHARDADVVSPVPWVLLAVGVAAGVLLAVRHGGGARRLLALTALPAVTGLCLAAWVGVTPGTYYPSKLMWHTAVLGLAPAAVVAVGALRAVDRAAFAGSSVVRVVGGAGVLVAVLYALVGPGAAFVGAWSTADGPTVLRVVSTPGAARAQLVVTDGPLITDTVARILLDAVDPRPGATPRPQEPLSLDEECRLLRGVALPTVVTDRPADQVRARFRCIAPQTPVVVPVRPE
ncbi:hypothetical protein KMZ32_10550 [Phycicoccus sp. MAQZ13P-2]|uniref:hypothetical protein n=1 Tax=Phycicoccus mangrovi TaxID=2840470 RepID=UPI001C005E4C|nr:hypothetical protein [Phycicoccus mangrovi]MBT9255914.1 hypothetical protein [Phycicoccus mangrovi]MBT9274508.1 hypothetical protein [Phycicoccus mangrovi]